MSDIIGFSYNVGDYIDIQRTVLGVATNDALTKAWMTVKLNATDADPGLIQKIITPGGQIGVGQITADGSANGTATLLFSLTITDTQLLTVGVRYIYDVQVMTASGKVMTADGGAIILGRRITQATS